MTAPAAPAAPKETVLRITGGSDCRVMAGLVSKEIEEGAIKVTLRSIGAGAVNQAIKSIAISSRFLKRDGIEVCVLPHFENAPAPDDPTREVSVMCLVVERR